MKALKLKGLLQFIVGIVLVVVGVLALFSTKLTFQVVTYLTVSAMFIYGVTQIVLVFKGNQSSKGYHMFMGIILVVFSILSLYNLTTLRYTIEVYAYFAFGFAFIFMAASSLANHITNFKNRNFVFTIILIVFDFALIFLSMILISNPKFTVDVAAIYIAISLMFSGFGEIGNSLNTTNKVE